MPEELYQNKWVFNLFQGDSVVTSDSEYSLRLLEVERLTSLQADISVPHNILTKLRRFIEHGLDDKTVKEAEVSNENFLG